MNNNKTSAFTLIEVIVAASILSVTIFGVYKLIGENTKLISNNEQYSFANTLFPSLQECIENIGFSYFSPDTTYNFNFGPNGNECISNTSPVTPLTLDGVEYSLSGTTAGNNTSLTWTLEVSADIVRPIQQEYTQLP